MAAMRAEETTAIMPTDAGIGVGALLGPLIIGVTISTIMMLLVVGLAPSPQEMEAQEKFKGWQGRQDELQRENTAPRRSQLL
jgi:hypothetical protein